MQGLFFQVVLAVSCNFEATILILLLAVLGGYGQHRLCRTETVRRGDCEIDPAEAVHGRSGRSGRFRRTTAPDCTVWRCDTELGVRPAQREPQKDRKKQFGNHYAPQQQTNAEPLYRGRDHLLRQTSTLVMQQ